MLRRFTFAVVGACLCTLLPLSASHAASAVPAAANQGTTAPPSPAAAARGPIQRTLTATTPTAASSGPTAAAAAPINCYFKVDNSHKSHHVSTNVNVVAHTTCTAPVSSITLTVNLYTYPDGRLVGVNGPKGNAGKSFFSLNAAAPCVTGRYYGYATTTVHFPPGYAPSPQSAQSYSSIIQVNC